MLAQEVTCPPAATPEAVEAAPLTGKKIGVTVAYLFVPFYANFKTGLADGAREFGFEYDLQDGEGKPEVELANMQDFIAAGRRSHPAHADERRHEAGDRAGERGRHPRHRGQQPGGLRQR